MIDMMSDTKFDGPGWDHIIFPYHTTTKQIQREMACSMTDGRWGGGRFLKHTATCIVEFKFVITGQNREIEVFQFLRAK